MVNFTCKKAKLNLLDSFVASSSAKKQHAIGRASHLKIVADVFSKLIEEEEMKVVDAKEIVDTLVKPVELEMNFFDGPNENGDIIPTERRIRTVVVECSYTDIASLLKSVHAHAHHHKADIVSVSPNESSLHAVTDKILASRRKTIIVLEQAEATNATVVNGLLSVLTFERDWDVALLMCVASCRTMLSAVVESRYLHALDVTFTPLKQKEEQLKAVMRTLIRPPLLHPPKMFVSFALLDTLWQRFLCGDASIAELKKVFLLSVLDNMQRQERYANEEENDFPDLIPEYFSWLDELTDLINAAVQEMNEGNGMSAHSGSNVDWLDVHILLQRNVKAFWIDNYEIGELGRWLNAMGREQLAETVKRVGEKHKEKALVAAAAQLETARDDEVPSTSTSTTPTRDTPKGNKTPAKTPTKMSLVQLQMLNKAARAVKSTSNVKAAKQNAIRALMTCLKEKLISWEGNDDYLLLVPPGITVPSVERQLAMSATSNTCVAYRALAAIDQFKPVTLARWGGVVAEGGMTQGQFFEAVAELERLGAVKDASKHGKMAVQLLARPTLCLA